MKPRVGVVSTAGRDQLAARRGADGALGAESYVVCDVGRVAWFEDGEERAERVVGTGTLLGVARGEGDATEAARTAAASVCRVLGKLWRGDPGDDPAAALVAFLTAAHTRMYWKSRERGSRLAASCAVAWITGDRLAYAEIGLARVWLWRDGSLRRVGAAWAPGERQRMLSGSLGLGDDTAVHLLPGRNTGTVGLRPGDQVLVATDGLHRALDDASAALVLQHVDDAQTAAVTLLERALARGATDGLTVALADLRTPMSPPDTATVLRTDTPPIRPPIRAAITEP